MTAPDIKAVLRTLDEFGSAFEKNNDTPPVQLASVGDGVASQQTGVLSEADRMYVRASLRKLQTSDLEELFTRQLTLGIGSGRPADGYFASPTVQTAMGQGFMTNALDTSGGAALVRQDLDPIIYELFIRAFPAWQRFNKTPANGADITAPSRFAFA